MHSKLCIENARQLKQTAKDIGFKTTKELFKISHILCRLYFYESAKILPISLDI